MKFTEEQLSKFNLQYYNSAVHKAAFAAPQYFGKVTLILYIVFESMKRNFVKYSASQPGEALLRA